MDLVSVPHPLVPESMMLFTPGCKVNVEFTEPFNRLNGVTCPLRVKVRPCALATSCTVAFMVYVAVETV